MWEEFHYFRSLLSMPLLENYCWILDIILYFVTRCMHVWLTRVGDKFHFMIVEFHQSIYQSFLTYYKCQSIWQRSLASSCWKLRWKLNSSEIKKEMCPFTSNTMTRLLFDTSTRTLLICRLTWEQFYYRRYLSAPIKIMPWICAWPLNFLTAERWAMKYIQRLRDIFSKIGSF